VSGPREWGQRLVSQRWVVAATLAVIVGVVAAVIAAVVVASEQVKYQSTATMAIDQPRAIAASGDAGVVSKLSALRTKYTGLVKTQTFAQPIAADLGFNVNSVRSQLFARSPQDSLLIQVGALTADRTTSQKLAEAASSALTDYVQNEQEAAQIPKENRFTITEVTPAGPGVKVSPTRKRIVGAAGLAGLLGFAAVFAALSVRARDD
jgi:capsular polysaccharide biosynthesis protein